MPTPLYVVQALAEVREGGSINMLDRQGVEALVGSRKATEWLDKASDSQYMDALNEMGRYISGDDDFLEDKSGEEDKQDDEPDGFSISDDEWNARYDDSDNFDSGTGQYGW